MPRPLKKLSNKRIIDMISRIRVRNNRQWMRLLKLALAGNPRIAKVILNRIVDNDRQITKWTARLH